MRPLVSSLQGRLVEVYFGFWKIDQVIKMYAEIRKEIDTWYHRMYNKVLALANVVGRLKHFLESAVDSDTAITCRLRTL